MCRLPEAALTKVQRGPAIQRERGQMTPHGRRHEGPVAVGLAGKNVHAVLVARHGVLVYERYFTGEDPPQLGPVTFDANTKHNLRSVSKSVVSLVLGIAIGKGQIGDLDQPVLPMLVGYKDLRTPELDRITLWHLLTMTHGVRLGPRRLQVRRLQG